MKFSLALFALLVGCATPTSVKISGDQKVTVHNLDKVNLPKAEVLDQNGKPMADQQVAWDVAPAEVAALSADKKAVEPKADGEATVSAKSGALSAKFTLVVSLPDAIEVGGFTDGSTLGVGATATLTGTVKADGEAVEGAAVTFESSDANIAKVEGNVVTGVAAGEATITAKSGELSQPLKVVVGDAAAAATTDAAAQK